jgi:hypothetical protein
MCADCKSISEEYERLHTNSKRALYHAEQRIAQLERDLAAAQRTSADYKSVLDCGMPAVLLAWMDSQTPAQLRSAVAGTKQELTP